MNKKKTSVEINISKGRTYVGLASFVIFRCLSIKVWNIFCTRSLISASAANDIFNSGSKKLGGNVVFKWIVWYLVPTYAEENYTFSLTR